MTSKNTFALTEGPQDYLFLFVSSKACWFWDGLKGPLFFVVLKATSIHFYFVESF